MMNKNYSGILVLFILLISFSLVYGQGTSSGVTILGGVQLYNETCIINSDCQSAICLANTTCGCTNSSQCSAGQCDNSSHLCGTLVLDAQFPTYTPGVDVRLNGSGWSSFATINVTFYNSTHNIFSFNVTANTVGVWYYNYTLPTSLITSNYTFEGNEFNSSLSGSDAIEVLPPYNFSGFIFNENSTSEPSNVTLYAKNGSIIAIDDEIYNFSFDYGQYYDIVVEPDNLTCAINFTFIDVAAQGFIGNFLGIDGLPTNTASYLEWDCLFSYIPQINYSQVLITASHTANTNLDIWKCTDFNFTARTCNDDTVTGWTNIGSVSAGGVSSFLNDFGDPMIGIAVPPTTTTTPSGGGGSSKKEYACSDTIDNDGDTLVDYPDDPGCLNAQDNTEENECVAEWSCGEWGECNNGNRMRSCTDLNDCSFSKKPQTIKSCSLLSVENIILEPSSPLYITKKIASEVEERPLHFFVFLLLLALILLFILDKPVIFFKQVHGNVVHIGIQNKPILFRRKVGDIILADSLLAPKNVRFDNKKIKQFKKGSVLLLLKRILQEKSTFSMQVDSLRIYVFKTKGACTTLLPRKTLFLTYTSTKEDSFLGEYHLGRGSSKEQLQQESKHLKKLSAKGSTLTVLNKIEKELHRSRFKHSRNLLNRVHQLQLIFRSKE